MRTLLFTVALLCAPPAMAQVVYHCTDTHPTDHEGLQALLDTSPEGTTIQLHGTCDFGASLADAGSVSILKDGTSLIGPAVIRGGRVPVQIGSQTTSGTLPFCSDSDTTCVQVEDVTVRQLEFDAPLQEAISVNAAGGGIVIHQNLVTSPRPVIVDFERLAGRPFVEDLCGCITVQAGMNSDPPELRAGAGIITGTIDITQNTCLGGASLDPASPTGRTGANRGIYIANANATVRVEQNYVENTFGNGIMYNADSPLFQPRADLLRAIVLQNTVVQTAPDIALAGRFPVGIHVRLDPNINHGPHVIEQNVVFIDVFGLGLGLDLWGLENFVVARNDIEVGGPDLISAGMTVWGSRQGPSGYGLVERNNLYGHTTFGILVGDDAGGFFGITHDITFDDNDLGALTTSFADVVLQADTTNIVFNGDADDTYVDDGVENEVNLDD